MHIPDDLSPTLAYDVAHAAHDIYGMDVDDWVRAELRRACDMLADALPAYKEIVDNRR